jgi:hypothetical protein
MVCGRCGANLTERSGIVARLGMPFSPRGRALVVLLVMSALWFVAGVRFDWQTWYLQKGSDRVVILHAEGSTSTLAIKALDEWIHRYHAHQLTDADRDRLFDHLLAWQGDLSRPWDPAMGDILLAAAMSNRLSPDRADRFAINSFVIRDLRVRPAIRPGDPVAIEYTGIKRGCTFQKLYLDCGINGSFRRPPPGPGRLAAASLGVAGDIHRGEIAAHDAGTDNLKPGRARLHLLLDHRFTYYSGHREDEYEHSAQTRQEVDVTILPLGTPLGAPAPNPAVDDAVARSVSLGVYRARSGQLFAQVRLEPAPVDRAFNVCVGTGHPQVAAQRFAAAKESDVLIDESNYEELLPIEVPKGQKFIEVQLIGSDDALRHSARLKSFWPGTITYTVPIRSYDAVQSPSRAPYIVTAGAPRP